MLVDLRLNLEIAQIVDLAHHLPGRDTLPQLHIQQTQLAINRGTHLQLALAFPHQQDIATHIGQIVLHLFHLDTAVLVIHLQPFPDQRLLLLRQFIILLRLQVLLFRDQFLPVETFVLFEDPAFAHHIHFQRGVFRLVVQLVLLHRHLRIAQQVLLFGQFRLRIQDL